MWLHEACEGALGTVGALVPAGHEAIVRLNAPDDSVDDWVDAYRALFVRVAAIGEAHTATPGRAWFAHEHGNEFGHIASPAVEGTDDEQGPALVMPQRTYRLTTGTVESVAWLSGPGRRAAWRHPDLFWPADRAWFVATDVDFWSLYVAGSIPFVSDVVGAAVSPVELVDPARVLVFEE